MPLSAVIAGAAVGASLLDTIVGNQSANKNYKLGKATLEWQKEMQAKAWEREDNAVQRRAADLKAAGMSPVLAAGQGAQASSPIQVSTPRYERRGGLSDAFGSGFNAVRAYQELVASNESIAYTQAQKELTKQQTKSVQLDQAAKSHDLSIAIQDGMPMNPSGPGKMFRDGKSFLEQFVGKMKESMQQAKPPIREKWFQDWIDNNRKKAAQKSQSKYYNDMVQAEKDKAYYREAQESLKKRSY